jgi:hypothetical protein
MPNRDGGQDTRYDLNRQVGYGRWQKDNELRAPEGAQRATTVGSIYPGEISVAPTEHGWEAAHERSTFSPGMSRREAFEDVAKYSAGPFKSEHRAKMAARGLASRDEDKLGQYHTGDVQHIHRTGED